VTRPLAQLVAYQRVDLEPGEEVTVQFSVAPAALAFTGTDGERIVEAGDIELWVGASCATRDTTATLVLEGPDHVVSAADGRIGVAAIERAVASV
jgi:beta-glucosidase